MNNLKKFATEADYSAATLNYPAVSWVTATDNVHFDKSAPTPTVNDKVMIASYDGSGDSNFIFYNCEATTSSDITSITLDDVAVEPITCQTESRYDAEQVHIAKYTFNGTTIGDWCAGDLGCSQASIKANIDVLIPSQITEVKHFPNNVYTAGAKVVCEATTPPNVSFADSGLDNTILYVPDASVNTYMADSGWDGFAQILPISQYSGNLPV